MKLYINELAPWERKKEYYNNIQLGRDLNSQTEAINNQTRAMLASQISSANTIIASQERISEGIDSVVYGINRVEQGIQGLQATFEWGISEIVWQIEQNRTVLKSILEVLSAPLDTQAKEYRNRADRAYAKGLLEDALIEYLESEKRNRFDFAIHISIGMIYLFHIVDKEKALEYFDKAIKYARGESNYYVSYSLLYKALIKRDLNLIQEAEIISSEACELSPNFAEAFYQNALYNAILKESIKAVKMLRKAISMDINYCLKANNEEAFKSIHEDFLSLLEELRSAENKEVNQKLNLLKGKKKSVKEIIYNENIGPTEVEIELQEGIEKVESLVLRNSLFDAVEAKNTLPYLFELNNQYIGELISRFQLKIYHFERERDSTIRERKSRAESRRGYFISIGGIVGFLSGFVGCAKQMGAVSYRDNFFVLLFSPFIFFGVIMAAVWGAFYAVGRALYPSEVNINDLNNDDEQQDHYLALIDKLSKVKS